jgi:hypothetical protein
MRFVEAAFWAVVAIVAGSISLKMARERSMQQCLALLKEHLDAGGSQRIKALSSPRKRLTTKRGTKKKRISAGHRADATERTRGK